MRKYIYLIIILGLSNFSFSQEKVALVRQGDKYLYIDESGNDLKIPEFESHEEFFEGLLAVRQYGKWGFVDTKGNFVVKPIYDKVMNYSDGYAAVKLGKRWFYIDKTGQNAFNKDFTRLVPFKNGMARVKYLGRYEYINTQGNIISHPLIDAYPKEFNDDAIKVYLDKKWGFLDKKGNWIIEPRFIKARDFSDGLAAYLDNEKWGYVDKKGNIVIMPKYKKAFDFNCGLARVEYKGHITYIDKKGKPINTTKMVITQDFSEDLAAVSYKKRYGYIDKTGKWIIEPKFDRALPFKNGTAVVMLNKKWGFIDKTGNYIIQTQYELAKPLNPTNQNLITNNIIAENKETNNNNVTYRGSGDPLKGLNVTQAQKTFETGNYYALIIGIDQYNGTWPKLQNAVRDAKAIENLLRTKYKFNSFKTLYNSQATRKEILQDMEWLVNNVKEKDNVFIYYSGHGEFDQKLNKGFWVPVDATTNAVYQYISNNDIQTFLGGIKSKHTLLVSDACFSGDIFRGKTISVPFENSDKYYRKVNTLISRQAITSGGIEPVMDGGRDGHSVFAYYMLKSLSSNPKKYIDAGELFNKILIPVTNNSDQQPKLSPIKNTGDEGGQFIFIKK